MFGVEPLLANAAGSVVRAFKVASPSDWLLISYFFTGSLFFSAWMRIEDYPACNYKNEDSLSWVKTSCTTSLNIATNMSLNPSPDNIYPMPQLSYRTVNFTLFGLYLYLVSLISFSLTSDYLGSKKEFLDTCAPTKSQGQVEIMAKQLHKMIRIAKDSFIPNFITVVLVKLLKTALILYIIHEIPSIFENELFHSSALSEIVHFVGKLTWIIKRITGIELTQIIFATRWIGSFFAYEGQLFNDTIFGITDFWCTYQKRGIGKVTANTNTIYLQCYVSFIEYINYYGVGADFFLTCALVYIIYSSILNIIRIAGFPYRLLLCNYYFEKSTNTKIPLWRFILYVLPQIGFDCVDLLAEMSSIIRSETTIEVVSELVYTYRIEVRCKLFDLPSSLPTNKDVEEAINPLSTSKQFLNIPSARSSYHQNLSPSMTNVAQHLIGKTSDPSIYDQTIFGQQNYQPLILRRPLFANSSNACSTEQQISSQIAHHVEMNSSVAMPVNPLEQHKTPPISPSKSVRLRGFNAANTNNNILTRLQKSLMRFKVANYNPFGQKARSKDFILPVQQSNTWFYSNSNPEMSKFLEESPQQTNHLITNSTACATTENYSSLQQATSNQQDSSEFFDDPSPFLIQANTNYGKYV